MFATVFGKTMRDQTRGLIGWGIAVVAITGVEIALWPSVRDMPDLEKFLAAYPEGMKELFNVDAMTSGAGFLNAELFSLTIPVMFLIYAIGRGARLVAGEEEAGTFEVLLTTPVTRTRILFDKAAALVLSVAILGLVLLGVTYLGATITGMGIGFVELASASLGMTLLGIEHGLLALAVGASWGRRTLAIVVGGTTAMAGYLLFAAAGFVEAIEPWRVASPFYQATEGGPIGVGLPARFVWLLVVGTLVLVSSVGVFRERDIAA